MKDIDLYDYAGFIILGLFLAFMGLYVGLNNLSKQDYLEYRKQFFTTHKNAAEVVVLNYDAIEHSYYFVDEYEIADGCLKGKFYSTHKPNFKHRRGAPFRRMTICSEFKILE